MLLLQSALVATLLLPVAPLVEPPARATDPTASPGPSAGPEMLVPKTGGGSVAPLVASAPSLPGFSEEIVFSNLVYPIAIAFAPGGRVYVAEKRGIIKEFDSIADVTPTIRADLRTQVMNYWDRGLLGMALDPAFETNGQMYVTYTHDAAIGETAPRWGVVDGDGEQCKGPPDGPGATKNGCVVSSRLSRLTLPAGTGLATETVLIEDWCQQFPSHSIGDVLVGPDGALYVGHGDGANFSLYSDYGQRAPDAEVDPQYPSNPCGDPPGGVNGSMTLPTTQGGALRSQDPRTSADPYTLDGTIIRVSPSTGAGLAGNPLIGSSDANARRIIAYGLRNPFRMAFRPGTQELWLGDVGWWDWEEINRITDIPPTAPINFGWPCREGVTGSPGEFAQADLCKSMTGDQLPHFTYKHGQAVTSPDCPFDTGASISGMAFAEGNKLPSSLANALFFSDYSRNCIWVMRADASGVPTPANLQQFAVASSPVQLRMGPDGYLYYVDHDDAPNGSVRRIKYNAPIARMTATPTSGNPPLHVEFDAAGSTPSGLTYAWDLDGDGDFRDSTSVAPSWTYDAPGTFTARLRVSNGTVTDTATKVIDVGNSAPVPSIATPSASLTWTVGQAITFSGSATDPEQGALPASALKWTLVLQHCPDGCHEHTIQQWNGVSAGSFAAPDHEYPSHLTLRLTATDQYGKTATVSRDLQPKTAQVTVQSNPAGIGVSVGGHAGVTPVSMTGIVGSAISVSAPTDVTMSGTDWAFVSWTDGGAASHDVVLPAGGLTLSASYGAFSDTAGSSFGTEIAWAAATGLTKGCGANRFCPTDPVTRGQMAAFLVRALGLSAGASPDRFSDIASSTFRADINKLAAAGITFGCGDGRYCPDDPVTRDQMASFLVRAFGYSAGASPDRFSDTSGSTHRYDINRLAVAGVTSGCGGGHYCPTKVVTREQMVAFLYRAIAWPLA